LDTFSISKGFVMTDQTQRLLDIMAQLRNPDGGCPWDLEQSFETIAPHTIEEAYEVADAISENDLDSLKDELGDLLFQVVYHAQLASELKAFDYNDVAQAISDKMIRRHPHVFGDLDIATAEAQTENWEKHKAAERKRKAEEAGERHSALSGVTRGLPALTHALKLQNRAARVGFDWPSPEGVIAKVREEVSEVEAEVSQGSDKDRLAEEIGDLLFSCVNLARKLSIDPETALRKANGKFEHRFEHMEDLLGKPVEEASLEEMDARWNEAKKFDRK